MDLIYSISSPIACVFRLGVTIIDVQNIKPITANCDKVLWFNFAPNNYLMPLFPRTPIPCGPGTPLGPAWPVSPLEMLRFYITFLYILWLYGWLLPFTPASPLVPRSPGTPLEIGRKFKLDILQFLFMKRHCRIDYEKRHHSSFILICFLAEWNKNTEFCF